MPNGQGSTRRKLWLANKKCFWCGIDTIWFDSKDGVTNPQNGATLDHIFRINDPRRVIAPKSVVLACMKCNVQRAKEQESNKAISSIFPPNTETKLIELFNEEEADLEEATETIEEAVSARLEIDVLWGLFSLRSLRK